MGRLVPVEYHSARSEMHALDNETRFLPDIHSFVNNHDYEPSQYAVQIGDFNDQLFTNDGLFPYRTNDTYTNFLATGGAVTESADNNCSSKMDFFFEMNKFYSPSQVVVPVIYSIICLVGLIGNSLVCQC